MRFSLCFLLSLTIVVSMVQASRFKNSIDSAISKAKPVEKKTIFYTTSDGCRPCARFKSDVRRNVDGLRDYLEKNYVIVEERAFAPSWRVEGSSERLKGYTTARDLITRLEKGKRK